MRCVPGSDADFEDAHVLKVERAPSTMRIWLSHASLRDASRPDRDLGPVRVTFTGVTEEQVAYYAGQGVTAAHPDPEMPLDFISTAEWVGGTLRLGGFRASQPWYEWVIVAAQSEVETVDAV